MFEQLSSLLAEKTMRNAELNEARHRMLARSSICSFTALIGLMILLTSAVVSSAHSQVLALPSTRATPTMPNQNDRPPAPPPSAPPTSGTQTRGGGTRPPTPNPSSPPKSGTMTKGG